MGLNYYATLWARSDINMSGIALSITYGFSPAQVIKRSKGASSDLPRPTGAGLAASLLVAGPPGAVGGTASRNRAAGPGLRGERALG